MTFLTVQKTIKIQDLIIYSTEQRNPEVQAWKEEFIIKEKTSGSEQERKRQRQHKNKKKRAKAVQSSVGTFIFRQAGASGGEK